MRRERLTLKLTVTGCALVAWTMGDVLISALVQSTASWHSWEARSAFGALIAGFASLGAAALSLWPAGTPGSRSGRMRVHQPNRLSIGPVQESGGVMPRCPAPYCWSCAMREASGTQRERVRLLAPLSSHTRPLYDLHRDCWVTTGNEAELRRMLHHVTWEAS